MRLEIEKQELLQALRLGQKFCGDARTNPVLACILLRAEEELLEIVATDTHRMLRYRLNPEKAKKHTPGSALIAGERLAGILGPAREPVATIEARPGRVDVKLGAGRFEIPCEDAGNYPALPAVPGQTDLILTGRALADIGTRCGVATTSIEERYAFDAVCFLVEKGEVRSVATDGKRLVLVVREARNASGFKGKRLIPPDILTQAGRLGPAEDPVEMAFGERHVFFRTGRAEMAVVDREGKFPAIEKIFGKQPRFSVEAGREDLLAAVQQVHHVLDDQENTVMVGLGKGALRIWGESGRGGKGSVEIPCKGGDGETMEMEFDPGLLVDFLKVMEDERIEIGLRGATEQVLLRERGSQVDYIVMPIRREDAKAEAAGKEAQEAKA